MSSPKPPLGRGLVAKVHVFFKGLTKDQKAEEKLVVQRLRTVRRSAVCAEVTRPEDTFTTKVVPKSDEAKKRLKNALQNNYLFAKLDEEQTKIVIDAVEEEKHKAGDVIISQGDAGDRFYLLEDGACEVWLLKPGKTAPDLVKHYAAGDSFGELALLYGAPRAATVKATTDCTLWAMDRVTFRNILLQTTSSQRKMYEKFLEDVPLLKGEAEAKKGGKVLMRYKRGDYFGELALLNNKPRAATVCAVTKCKCASIDRQSFKRLFGKLDDILQRNKTEYNEKHKASKKVSWFG